MFKKILLAYDGSGHTAAALRQSSELARLCNAELHVLGIVATMGGAAIAQASEPYDLFCIEREQIEKALADAYINLHDQGLHITTSIREGDPANEIAACVHEIKADLVVVGHTDKGFIARWLLGSTGTKLIHDLPCNLLIAATS